MEGNDSIFGLFYQIGWGIANTLVGGAREALAQGFRDGTVARLKEEIQALENEGEQEDGYVPSQTNGRMPPQTAGGYLPPNGQQPKRRGRPPKIAQVPQQPPPQLPGGQQQ